MEGSFKRINNQGFNISTKEQTKTLMTCTDKKRWILDDIIHILEWDITILVKREAPYTGEPVLTLGPFFFP